MIRCFLVLNLIVVEPPTELYVRLLQEETGVETTEGAPCHGSHRLLPAQTLANASTCM